MNMNVIQENDDATELPWSTLSREIQTEYRTLRAKYMLRNVEVAKF